MPVYHIFYSGRGEVEVENLLLSFNTVMPMFLVMLVGYALRASGVANGTTVSQMNKLLMRSLVPVMMFQNIYGSQRGELASAKLIAFCVLGVLGMYALSFAIGMLTEKEGARRGVVIQALYRGNMMAMAVPLAESLLGEGKQGPLAVCLAIVIPLFNVLAVITLELFHHGKPDIKVIVKDIATNGLILGCVAGILFYVLNSFAAVCPEDGVQYGWSCQSHDYDGTWRLLPVQFGAGQPA